MSDLLSCNNRKTHRCWSDKNNCDWAHLSACKQKYGYTSRLVTTGSVLGYCGTAWNCCQNPVFFFHSFPSRPPPRPRRLISCICGGCVFCEPVSICSCGVRCGTCEPHETQLTLLILPLFFFFLRKFEFRISVICKRSKFVHCNIIKRTHSWRGACWSTEGLYLHEQSVSFLHR